MIFDTPFVRLPVNQIGRDLIVGDVHGQGAMLDCLLAGIRFDPTRDRLLLLGDLIDRGPDGGALIERVREEHSWVSLCGNHEALMLAAEWSEGAARAWRRNGNDWAAVLSEEALDGLRMIVRGFPLALELPLADGRTIGLVHAEVPPGQPWSAMRSLRFNDEVATEDTGSTNEASVIWGQRRIQADCWMRFNPKANGARPYHQVKTWNAVQPIPEIDLVVAGHVVIDPPIPHGRSNTLWIDTGAYAKGGLLTAIDVVANCYWQVERGSAEITGPVALPPLKLPERAWRPTAEIEAAAADDEARQIERLRWLFP
jgi:serine/threonine protein phosphatase 1